MLPAEQPQPTVPLASGWGRRWPGLPRRRDDRATEIVQSRSFAPLASLHPCRPVRRIAALSGPQTLYSYEGDFRALKVLIAAEFNGVDIATPEFKVGTDNVTPEFLAKNPLGKVPVMDTPEGSLFESSAIARYVARLRRDSDLCGRSFFESGQVDAWVDFCSHQVEVPSSLIVFPIFGYTPYKKQIDMQAWTDLTAALAAMEKHLLHHTYFVGESITLADIALVSALFYPMTMVLDAEARASFPCVTRWFTTCVGKPQFAARLGETTLCVERMLAEGASKAAAAKGGKKGGDKKAGNKKGGDKKAAAKADAKPAAAAAAAAAAPAPKPKAKKWHEELPPSSMNMDDFKRFYSNAPTDPESGDRDFFAVMPEFWASKFDKEGYSIWFCEYKYNDENKVSFMTSNLVGGFVQRADEVRKVAFGNMLILNEEAPFRIAGCWMIRGQSIQPLLDCNPDAEYYDWTKVDPASEEDRTKVGAFWCCYEDFLGIKVQDAKMFK